MSEVLTAGGAATLRKPTNRVLKKFQIGRAHV